MQSINIFQKIRNINLKINKTPLSKLLAEASKFCKILFYVKSLNNLTPALSSKLFKETFKEIKLLLILKNINK